MRPDVITLIEGPIQPRYICQEESAKTHLQSLNRNRILTVSVMAKRLHNSWILIYYRPIDLNVSKLLSVKKFLKIYEIMTPLQG